MWEWLVNYGGFLGLPSAKDIYSLPGRYRQWRQEGRDAEIERERDLNNLYREQRKGLIPPDPQNTEEDFQIYMGPPDSSTGGGRWSNQLPLETKEEFEKRMLLEKLQRGGGGFSI